MHGRWPLAIIFWLCITFASFAATTRADDVNLYYYSAENCPHCREYGPVIQAMTGRLSGVELIEKDIWRDRSAFEELVALLETHGDLPVTTPTLFLGDKVWIGIDQESLGQIEARLHECLASACPDAMARLASGAGPQAEAVQPAAEPMTALPLLGSRDAREVSLPLVALILGLLDSINPCAFFVLLFLLTLMIHAHSRPRMLAVGVVFVCISGLIYFLFMAAWLNLFLATGGVRLVTLLAGLAALLIGALNIKDYFLFHRGPSLSIPEKVKPGLYRRARELVKSAGYPSLLGGTALLAVAANSYELLCTAGFPMVFTRILTLQQLPTWQYYGYLALYNVVYVTPLLIIVIIFAVTLGAHQLSQRQGRLLKLIAGVMMTDMGLVLTFSPDLLQSPTGTLVMFGAALATILLILLVDRCRRGGRAG